jgi:hypothetical protein
MWELVFVYRVEGRGRRPSEQRRREVHGEICTDGQGLGISGRGVSVNDDGDPRGARCG